MKVEQKQNKDEIKKTPAGDGNFNVKLYVSVTPYTDEIKKTPAGDGNRKISFHFIILHLMK